MTCVTAILLATAGSAQALKPGTHAAITQDSCAAAGLPDSFCARVATENYITDANEWDDLHAHAQIDDNETACGAADLTAERVWTLAELLRRELDLAQAQPHDDNVGAAATALGRILHTIQDNCAHHGMPNPQHAWFSLSDFCDGTQLSPDIQSDAKSCARIETDAVMRAVAAAISRRGLTVAVGTHACPLPDTEQGKATVCDRRFLPGPRDACQFFATAQRWDGVDRTWENRIVTVGLRGAVIAGLEARSLPASLCGGDEAVLSPATSAPVLDVSIGAPSCAKSSLFCLGKADGGDHPFLDEDEHGEAGHDEDSAGVASGGCTTTSGTAATPLLVIASALLLRRRRPGHQ